MAYSTGGLILDDHYNEFASGDPINGTANHSVANINSLWGVGNGDKGYGQSSVLSEVTTGATVTATQWATMLTRMTTIANHQASSITAISNPTAGNTISAYTALSGNLNTIYANRLNVAANGSDSTNSTSGTGSWTNSTTHTATVTFADVDSARYYFNAGGQLRFSFARSGGTSHTKNTEWTDLCNDAGTIIFGANSTTAVGQSGTNSVLTTTTGYYQLATSDTVIFLKYQDSSPYTANYIHIGAKTNGGATNGGNGYILTFTVSYIDAAPEDSANDTVDGTITTTVVERPPSTTHLTNVWGNPSYGGTNSQS